jgi:hypothetical protein
MANKGIILKIGTEYTNKAMKSAQADLRKLDSESRKTTGGLQSFGSKLSSFVGPALLGTAAAAGTMALAFAVEGVKSAAAEEQQLALLKNALDNVNQGFKLPEISNAIDKLQMATGVLDTDLRPAFQTLVTATRDAAEAQDLLSLAVDISVAKQKDLGSVATALAKASNGQASALTRLGVPLTDGAKKAGNFSIAVGELGRAFGGAAAASVDTFAGKVKLIQIAIDEAKESFGKGFLTGIETGLGGLTDLKNGLVDLQPDFEELGRSVGELAGQLLSLITQVQDLYNSLGIFKELFNPIKNTANQFQILGLALETVVGQLGFNLPQAAKLTEDQLNALNNTDWSVITGNVAALTEDLNNAAQDRDVNLFLKFHGASAPGVGITSALNDFFTELYKAQDEVNDNAGTVTEAAKKIDPFKAWSEALSTSVRKATVKAALLAKGLPAELADSVINADGFNKIYKRLIAGGQEAIDKFIKAFAKSADPSEAIGNRVNKITSTIEKNLQDAKTAIEDFKTLSADFAKSIKDFGAISTFQPDAGVPITAAGITANVRQRLAMVREFSSVLQQLQSAKVPLNQAALLDLVGMGPMEGLPYAKALLDAGASTISGLNKLQGQFVTPANIIGNIGAEASSGTTMAALQSATNFNVQAGGINITVNGEITAQTRQDLEDAVTSAFLRVGREQRNRGRAGVR